MHAHAHPILWEVRVFSSDIDSDGKNGYDRREADKILAVCLARKLAENGHYFISMMHGKFGHKEMSAVLKEAKKHGATNLWFERHGKIHSLIVK